MTLEQLNQMPINAAARKVIERLGQPTQKWGAYLLQLAQMNLMDEYHPEEPAEPDDERIIRLVDVQAWSRAAQASLVEDLVNELELDADELEASTGSEIQELAEQIAHMTEMLLTPSGD